MSKFTCSVEDCSSPMPDGQRLRKGLCPTHYQRMRKFGSPSLPILAVPDHDCEQCGARFERQSVNKKYCSDACRQAASRSFPCRVCGDPMLRSASSLPAGQAAHRTCAKRDRMVPCAFCAEPFTPGLRAGGVRIRCCSKACARRLDVREGRNNLQDGVQVGRDPEKRRRNGELSTRKRRARIAGSVSERYTRQEIAERDEFVCWLCNEPVDMSLRHPDSRSASVDHVVPLSLGGDDLKSNVRLAHLGENLARGNRVDWKVSELTTA